MPGSRMFIDPKMQVPVEDLIKGMIVQSGNDATMALAEGVGGTVEHFVELMNEQAKALGMKNTTYKNPEGLTEPGHTTTARDLSILATRLMRDFPRTCRLLRHQEVPLPGHAVDQRHQPQPAAVPRPDRRRPQDRPYRGGRLLHDRHRQARLSRNLAGRPPPAVDRAGHLQRERARQRVAEAAELGLHGLRRRAACSTPARPVATPAVWKGKSNTVKLGRPEAIVVAVPAGTRQQGQDPGGAPRPAGRAVHQEPGRSARSRSRWATTRRRWPRCRWWRWKPCEAGRRSSAAPGMPSGSGSSKVRRRLCRRWALTSASSSCARAASEGRVGLVRIRLRTFLAPAAFCLSVFPTGLY